MGATGVALGKGRRKIGAPAGGGSASSASRLTSTAGKPPPPITTCATEGARNRTHPAAAARTTLRGIIKPEWSGVRVGKEREHGKEYRPAYTVFADDEP